jgi:hypothetical protein
MKLAASEFGLHLAERPGRKAPTSALVLLAMLALAFVGCGDDSTRLPTALPSAESASDDQAHVDEAAAIAAAEPIDPKSIAYQECCRFYARAASARALALDAEDRIYVGDDKGILRYSSSGEVDANFNSTAAPRCLAIGGKEHRYPGRIYAGDEDHIALLDASGRQIASWTSLGDKASIASIAVAENSVFVADAGNRIVWNYDAGGKIVDRIGEADPARHVPGFMITGHFFDVAMGGDGLVYAVNPRALRIEGYTHQGDLETHWGKGSPAVEDFFGCCNPVHLAVMPDGRFVTAEKGIPRVKIYSREGKLQCVVAGPGQFSASTALMGLAVDSHQHVIVLVSSDHPIVEVFVPKASISASKL